MEGVCDIIVGEEIDGDAASLRREKSDRLIVLDPYSPLRKNWLSTAGIPYALSMRMENRGGAKEGTPELYFTDPDGLPVQLQDTRYCGGGGVLGDVCTA